MRPKAETLALAARHVASGKKIIFGFRRPLKIGHVVRIWAGSNEPRVYEEEYIEDQPLVVVRQTTYQEYLDNRPPEFVPRPPTQPRPGLYFYELTCE